MLKNERQENIISILEQKRFITVQELTNELFTSYSSVLRDLRELEERGIVNKSYGGVQLSDNNRNIIPYSIRIDKNTIAKKIMAEKAAGLINDGDVIFLDQSSSASYLATKITHKKGITVITNNIEIVMHLSQYNINVICTGGKLFEGNKFALVGYDAENVYQSIHSRFAFFSGVGVDEKGNIYDYFYEEVAIRKKMFKNTDNIVFLCDSNKINQSSIYKQTNLADIQYLICENDKAKCFEKFKNLTIL